MTKLPATLSAPPSLSEAVHSQTSIFAVVDGALYDDLPNLLQSVGLEHRSLFLDHADKEVERAGPWLVPLKDPGEIDSLLIIVGWLPAAVFWSCEGGDAVLYRHLRSINKVIYPYQPSPDIPDVQEKAVLFRHWDPVVLSQVLPVLPQDQFNRVIGPAQSLIMYAVDNGGLLKASPAQTGLLAPKRMLTITGDQAAEIAEARKHTSHRRIAQYLRAFSPTKTAHLDERQLMAAIGWSEVSGRKLGLTTEKALARWAYLYIVSGGNVAQSSKVSDWLAQGDHSPNRKIAALVRGAVIGERQARGEGKNMPKPLGMPNVW